MCVFNQMYTVNHILFKTTKILTIFTLYRTNVYLRESRTRLQSVERAPVAAVAGSQSSGYEQDEIHEPPDPQASESQELPNSSARVAQAEAVHAEAAQEKGVEERGDEVVTRESNAGFIPAEEFSRPSALDAVQGRAQHLSVIHVFVYLALISDLYAAVSQLQEGCEVSVMIKRFSAVDELLRKVAAEDHRGCRAVFIMVCVVRRLCCCDVVICDIFFRLLWKQRGHCS